MHPKYGQVGRDEARFNERLKQLKRKRQMKVDQRLYTEHSTPIEVGEDADSHIQMQELRRCFPSA